MKNIGLAFIFIIYMYIYIHIQGLECGVELSYQAQRHGWLLYQTEG